MWFQIFAYLYIVFVYGGWKLGRELPGNIGLENEVNKAEINKNKKEVDRERKMDIKKV